MAKPIIHARSSARLFGGKPSDYLDIHILIDSSREAFPDLRHRAATHTSWFITTIIPRIFGETRKNSENRTYSPRIVAEQHVLEDFKGKFIPSLQDFCAEIEFKEWMDNGKGESGPPSNAKLKKYNNTLPQEEKDRIIEHIANPLKGLKVHKVRKITAFEMPRRPFAERPCALAARTQPGILD